MQNAAANFTLIYTLPRQISAQSTLRHKGPSIVAKSSPIETGITYSESLS